MTTLADAALVICITVLVVLFWGAPDLHDKLIASLDQHSCIPTPPAP